VSLVPQGGQIGLMGADSRRTPWRISDTEDRLAQRGGFEPWRPFISDISAVSAFPFCGEKVGPRDVTVVETVTPKT